ncbi:MAG: hypothetical protein EU552_02735 [Promethearchaeota archaeon]|jgi:hypothetical protein|nr:MAG: hypothetical protein EU552_02735 [Candidatus Lokiarchaeota archaeon]
MTDYNDLRLEIPSYAYIALARRGMEKISLDQCFLPNCDNQDVNLLEPFKIEESEEEEKITKKVHIKCKKCGGTFILKLETIKNVAKSTQNEEDALSMGLVYALDETGKNLGHIGYF